jgi:hypothetical protein
MAGYTLSRALSNIGVGVDQLNTANIQNPDDPWDAAVQSGPQLIADDNSVAAHQNKCNHEATKLRRRSCLFVCSCVRDCIQSGYSSASATTGSTRAARRAGR